MSARPAVAAMKAYTLELREARTKLNQNESPLDVPADMKRDILDSVIARPWNRYPDFESAALREALAKKHSLTPDNILVGNGSNELLAAAIGTFVGPGTSVAMLRPSFALYEKLVTVAGGTPVFADVDPSSPHLPRMGAADVIIVASPNNPTGGVLAPGAIDELLATGATVLLDRAYGEFARDTLPALHPRLVVFSTFSKAWGLAGLRVGWLATAADTAREIRKVKLPYSLNIISEAAAVAALARPERVESIVASAIAERTRVAEVMTAVRGVEPFPSSANFITFRTRDAKLVFEHLCARGVLVRDVSGYPGLANCLRVSIGTPAENTLFLAALKEIA